MTKFFDPNLKTRDGEKITLVMVNENASLVQCGKPVKQLFADGRYYLAPISYSNLKPEGHLTAIEVI